MNIDKTLKELEKAIDQYRYEPKIERIGNVTSIADGVVKIDGLATISSGELLEFRDGIYGLVLNLEEDEVGAIVLGDYLKLKEGDEVKGTGRLLSIPVSPELIGRIVDPLGQPLDKRGAIQSSEFMPLEKVAPGVTEREPVDTPLQTGIKSIDSMIPVGRGQRELIIGDRGTGKTA